MSIGGWTGPGRITAGRWLGERLVDGEYRAIELHTEDNGDLWSHSDVLGVDFHYRVADGAGQFLVRDSATGEWLNDLIGEQAAPRSCGGIAARAAEARAEAAEAELHRLRRSLDDGPGNR